MAKVNFKRIEDSSNLNNIEIEDGAFIVTGDGKIYTDYGENRIAIGGTPDTEMSDRSTNAVENNVIKSYVDTNVSTINKNLGGKILWANLNPNTDFAGQIITLASDDYDMLLWLYKLSSTANYTISCVSIKGYGTKFNNISGSGTNNRRSIHYRTARRYSVDSCLAQDGSIANNALIPLYVIGYNTGLFD